MVKAAKTDIDEALALKRIQQARTALILDEPFFGTLVMRLTTVADWSAETAWTDGTRLGYNPAWIVKQTTPETKGVFGHETLHNVMGHPWRRDCRDPYRWNVAADFAINPIVKASGMILPGNPMTLAQFLSGAKGHLDDPQFHGLSAEEIYPRLPADLGKAQGGGCGGDFGPGAVREAPGQAQERAEQQAEWQVAVAQAAAVAARQGNLPGALSAAVGELLRPKVDWKSLTLQFAQSVARGDYTWKRPNRRYAAAGGLYLPSLYSEELGPMGIATDTSGSVAHVLDQFGTELNTVVEVCRPEVTHALWCDCKVCAVATFDRGDPVVFPKVAQGGTDFRPVFQRIADDKLDLACLIYLTDLEGNFPEEAPEYPVLWVTINDKVAPFGDTVRMEL